MKPTTSLGPSATALNATAEALRWWRRFALVLSMAVLLSVAGWWDLSRRSKLVPFVYFADEFGRVTALGQAQALEDRELFVGYELRRALQDLRTVAPVMSINKEAYRRALSTRLVGDAREYAKDELLRENPSDMVGEGRTREVRELRVFRQEQREDGTQVWLARWHEYLRKRAGDAEISSWEAVAVLGFDQSADPNMENPLNMRVLSIRWNRSGEASGDGDDE